MVRACGLRIGPRGYELVLIEGSAKKHKVITSKVGTLSFATDPAGAARILKDLAKQNDIPRDRLRVVVEGGLAAFRKVNLPINDDDKIEKVVKFEVESELPQFNIEDVVVDWSRLNSTSDSCSLITTIVKKADLQEILDVCERGGVEPIEVDSDTSAIVNAAHAAGALDPESACLVVYVGEESSSIAVIDGLELRDLRSIQQGALTHLAVAAPDSADADADEDDEEEERGAADSDALASGDSTDGIEESLGESLDELEALEDLEEAAPASGPEGSADVATETEHDAARTQILARLTRELARSISGARTLQPIRRVLVAGYEMPGLIGSEILDVSVEALDGLPDTSRHASRCATAYGAAVAQLGGGILDTRMRREELRFTGTMERLELPLAVASLLLVTFLGVWNIGLGKKFDRVNSAVRYWRDSSVAFMIPMQKHLRGNLDPAPASIQNYVKNFTGELSPGVYRDDQHLTRFDQMTFLRGKLRSEIATLERELGQGAEFTQPQSALKGATYVLDILDDTREGGARPSIRYLKADYSKASSTRSDSVTVTLDLTFFAEDTATGTEHFEAFRRAIEHQPWTIEFSPARTDPLENGEGISIAGLRITMDVSKTEEATS